MKMVMFKRVMFIAFVIIMFFGVSSCVPPREVSKIEYRYVPGGVYNYSLKLRASGNFSYLFINYTGDIVIKSDVEMNIFEGKKGKNYYFLKFSNIRVEGLPSSFVESFSNLSFYMDSKGNKVVDNVLLHYLLDILIPVLPEGESTNESRFRTSSLKIENLGVLGEVSNSTVVSNRGVRGFDIGYDTSAKLLELEFRDIVVASLVVNGFGKVMDGVLEYNKVGFNSGTMIPLNKIYGNYKFPITQVIGFKGSGVIEIKRKGNI